MLVVNSDQVKVAALIQNTVCLVDVSSEAAVSGEISIISSFMMGLSLLNLDADYRVYVEVLIIISG